MPRLSPATTAHRRARIVDAAARCFFRLGLSGTSVDDICAEAGISKGALYVHFPSKEAVFEAVLAQRVGELGEVGGETAGALGVSIFDNLIAPTMLPENGRFGLELVGASATDPVARQRMHANLAEIRARMARAIDALRARGAAPASCNSEAVAETLETFVLGAVCRHAITPQEPPAAVRARLVALVEALVAG